MTVTWKRFVLHFFSVADQDIALFPGESNLLARQPTILEFLYMKALAGPSLE
jgi:hypothetical protein